MVFVFSASLSDVAAGSLNIFAVGCYVSEKKSELLFCVIGVSVSSRTSQIKICECCVCFESFT